jgi:RNA polymerase sigma factor (sigma-70 family)
MDIETSSGVSRMRNENLGSALHHIHCLFGEGTRAGLPDARLLERYSTQRDESAFEVLVQRHGPMVMGVCRGVLDDSNDADDAFQATFLLLARKSSTLWVDDSIGGWLHRVACRIALQVRADLARRREQERRAAALAAARACAATPYDDSCAVIHQEIDRLPARYRKPIVLCYLEEMSYQQAAGHLRWTEGTTRGRLARARHLLRKRLIERGVTLVGAGGGAFGLTVLKPASAACVSSAMREAAVRTARHFALGNTATEGSVSTTAPILVNKLTRTMMIAKLKWAGAAAFVLAALTAFAATWAAAGPTAPGAKANARTAPESTSAAEPAHSSQDDGATLSFNGRVLLPDGKPAPGAALYMILPARAVMPKPILKAKTDGDGRFQFSLPKADVEGVLALGPFATITILATAEGLGPDWVTVGKSTGADLTFRLVDDSIAIAGRILDLEGRPVAGAKITRGAIKAERQGGIDRYLKSVKEEPMMASNHRFDMYYWGVFELPGHPDHVTTDQAGRFRLSGIGHDRIVEIGVEGPTIQSARITAMTRVSSPVSSPPGTFAGTTIYGATFDHAIPPGRALTGIVRDKRSKQPLAGIEVCGTQTTTRVRTDARGRYTLPGFPKGNSYGLMVLAGDKAPYFVTALTVPDAAGLEPIAADVDCVPGITMRLTLVDKATGKPIPGADVFYRPIYPNPHAREVPGYAPVQGGGPYNSGQRQEDGAYVLGVLPGPGGIFVRTTPGKYRPACVDPKEFFKAGKADAAQKGQDRRYGDTETISTAEGEGIGGMPQSQFSAIVLVNPADGSGPLEGRAELEPDPKREVTAIGPDGEALTGLTAEGEGAEVSPASVLTVSGLNPRRPKRFIIHQNAKNLVGCLIAKGDEPASYKVKLDRAGVITGRLVDEEGKPRAGVNLMTLDWQAASYDAARGVVLYGQKTGSDGRFRYEGLVPGQSYSAHAVGDRALKGGFGVVIDKVVLKPGETRDLGDVKARDDRKDMPQ